MNYERHLTYFQFLIYKKIIENSLEDLNYTHITKLAQEKINWMDDKPFFLFTAKVFFVYNLDIGRCHVLGLNWHITI